MTQEKPATPTSWLRERRQRRPSGWIDACHRPAPAIWSTAHVPDAWRLTTAAGKEFYLPIFFYGKEFFLKCNGFMAM
jgi:hypothetical protein